MNQWRVKFEASNALCVTMGLRMRVGTGLFVALAMVWYFIAPESADCTDMTTGETVEGCVEFFEPLLTYFCALPPLVFAVLLHTLTKGDEHKPSLLQSPVDEEGRAIVAGPTETDAREERLAFSLRAGMTVGGFAFAGAYALIFIIGLLALPLGLLCGMIGSNCTEDDFLWAENSINFSFMVMRIGFGVFLVSAVGTFVRRAMSEGTVWPAPNPQAQQKKKVVVPCPSCEKKLRFPANYAGRVKCPTCDHVFVLTND